ncbi:SMP-30/gluconolactonase/LRE family protein [Actinomadura algeriensis]|uniref:SMP-30/gluconolaconase/LRE-like protein n=1 Tax=Actinomadura algeriensis TaxID=1679523 RepID=A0ABR9K4I5_9ACTN|nr:hypothetical protein [Actinomadura algeriensis]MBE1537481.1 hypothetical protein [Actinomadura algeriensis]
MRTTAYELPGGRVCPEGIAADPRTGVLYAGSFGDGTIYRMSGRDRVAEVFLPAGADGRDTANGLEVGRRGRLWVTDSDTGVAVYDLRTRRLLARFDLPGNEPGFVNDLAITPDGTAHNVGDAITRWSVSPDGRAAWLRRRVVDAELDAPTTLVRARGTLYVVRSRFDEGGPLGPGTPQTPFTIAAVRGL